MNALKIFTANLKRMFTEPPGKAHKHELLERKVAALEAKLDVFTASITKRLHK